MLPADGKLHCSVGVVVVYYSHESAVMVRAYPLCGLVKGNFNMVLIYQLLYYYFTAVRLLQCGVVLGVQRLPGRPLPGASPHHSPLATRARIGTPSSWCQ